MRRAIAVAVLALVLVALVAAPAMAQLRDPFDPLVEPGTGVSVPGDPAPGTDPGTAPPIQPTEQMPNTGSDTTDWTGGAYVLMVLGGALLVLGRLYRNPEVRRRA